MESTGYFEFSVSLPSSSACLLAFKEDMILAMLDRDDEARAAESVSSGADPSGIATAETTLPNAKAGSLLQKTEMRIVLSKTLGLEVSARLFFSHVCGK